ncbi:MULTISPECIES: hypothetical protein [unclassified Gordonia (in: high G+C Gram-positive bacteria)]|nr:MULTISPECIES: hypothetical protein [unclassified Gordonia (in: high G+C Gram-positive bacteria)]MCX2753655.1 hypothetical protein [Gordonia sp. 4N]
MGSQVTLIVISEFFTPWRWDALVAVATTWVTTFDDPGSEDPAWVT